MGRGRAKAKQTRVARELKYHSPNTDLDALQRELASGSPKSRDDYAEFGDQVDDEADDEDDGNYDDPSSDSDWRSRGR